MSEKIPLSDFPPRRDRRGGCCVERSNVEKDSPRSETEIHVMRKCWRLRIFTRIYTRVHASQVVKRILWNMRKYRIWKDVLRTFMQFCAYACDSPLQRYSNSTDYIWAGGQRKLIPFGTRVSTFTDEVLHGVTLWYKCQTNIPSSAFTVSRASRRTNASLSAYLSVLFLLWVLRVIRCKNISSKYPGYAVSSNRTAVSYTHLRAHET